MIARGLSLDVAPSSQKHVVVSGLDTAGAGNLLISDDGGATWQDMPIPMTDTNSAPYLAVISTSDPNRIFVRTDASKSINGTDTANDALLLTLDGGSTWTTLIQRSAKLYGFALSPDESTLLVGYGDPVSTATYVAPTDLGIYRADVATIVSDVANASTHFEKIFGASVTCLRWTPTGLFACTSQKALGFEVGRAPDATFTLSDANPFTPLLQLSEVRPLPCAKGTRGYACYSDPINGFASVCGLFQTSCDASAPPPPASPRDAGLDAAAPSEARRDGGSAGTPSTKATSSQGGSSCACRSAGSQNAEGAPRLLAFALGVAFARRRRSTTSRRSEPRPRR
jgi:MYXO-CTERM domain-containing protein